jgi:23S rRNA (guanine2445-N2)-methyltransferase / 23S rRNA (guanine2069-N7)-methyltransferase
MSALLRFYATTAKGLEPLLARELAEQGARGTTADRGGVAFEGSLEVAYHACLWSRVANRILLPLATVAAPTPAALYAGVRSVPWAEHVDPRGTIAVDCAGARAAIAHTHYAALTTKDAIVDQLRESHGCRPDVRRDQPDVRVNVYLDGERALVSIDLSGESLHRRHYREAAGRAPLKETLAAAVLVLAGWPEAARAGAPLLDPMCGSGTLVIEGALMALNIAPARGRRYFGFLGWRGHRPSVWRRVVQHAGELELRDPRRGPVIHGYDADRRMVRTALANAERAGLHAHIHLERRDLMACRPVRGRAGADTPGLVVTNPPYGARLGGDDDLPALYRCLGDVLRHRFMSWRAFVLTGDRALAAAIGLRAVRRHVLYNGAIECRLLEFPIASEPVRTPHGPRWRRTVP